MVDKRARDLSSRPDKTYDEQILFDETGLIEAQRLSIDAILRKGTVQTLNSVISSQTLDYTDYDLYVVNITAGSGINLTISNINDGDRRSMLVVNRSSGATQEYSILGADYLQEGEIKGVSTVIYEIHALNGEVSATQINAQRSGSLVLSDLSISSGSISLFNFFDYQIQGKMCFLEASIVINDPTSTTEYDLTLANFDVNLVNSGIALTVFNLDESGKGYIIDNTQIRLNFNGSDTLKTVRISGQFIIE
jgi:hypothetical protein